MSSSQEKSDESCNATNSIICFEQKFLVPNNRLSRSFLIRSTSNQFTSLHSIASLILQTSTNISSSIIIAAVPDNTTSSFFTQASMGVASEARTPLESTTNDARTPTPSPPSGTAKTGPILRRKSATQALGAYLDSSESYPSPHSSIYEAPCATSQENLASNAIKGWDDAGWGNALHTIPEPNNDEEPAWLNITIDASGSPVPVSFLRSIDTVSPMKSVHVPHVLEPITEQSSLSTLRPLSIVAHSSAATLRRRASSLKRKSFSTSDLPPSSNATSQRYSPPSHTYASPTPSPTANPQPDTPWSALLQQTRSFQISPPTATSTLPRQVPQSYRSGKRMA